MGNLRGGRIHSRRSLRPQAGLASLAVAALVLAACSSEDDATIEPAAEADVPADDTGDAPGDTAGDSAPAEDAEPTSAAPPQDAEPTTDAPADTEPADPTAAEPAEPDPTDEVFDPLELADADNLTQYLEERYGVFEPFTLTGSGDEAVQLPEDVNAGMLTISHDPEVEIIIQSWTTEHRTRGWAYRNRPDSDGLSGGVSVFGVDEFERLRLARDSPIPLPMAVLDVTADGDWEITVSPVSEAPMLDGPVSGNTHAVYLLDGSPGTLRATHEGDGNFIVFGFFESLAGGERLVDDSLIFNTVGPSEGEWEMRDDTVIVHIDAADEWTLELAE